MSESMTTAHTRSDSVIHDIGYQRYDGPRLGRGYAARSLFVHGLRTAFGLGRSAKAKIFPWIVVGLVGVVALVIAIAAAQGQPVSYPDFLESTSILSLIFLAVVAPELVSRDLRNSLLPLYFSRPLRRTDYALVRLAALTTAIFLLVAGPMTVVFLVGAFGEGKLLDQIVDVLGGYALAAVYAILFSTVGLVVASIASRRAFAAGAIAAVFMVTLPIAGVLMELGNNTLRQVAGVFSPILLMQGIGEWWFEDQHPFIGSYGWLYGTVAALLSALCVGLLLLRYRKVSL
jgi:ABC-2 type transport system permease protein